MLWRFIQPSLKFLPPIHPYELSFDFMDVLIVHIQVERPCKVPKLIPSWIENYVNELLGCTHHLFHDKTNNGGRPDINYI